MVNIYTFLIGIATAFFTIFAIHILCWRRPLTRFQTVLGIIMAVWALWCAKDIVLTFPGMYREEVLNWVMIIDGWSALTYTVFVMECVVPGWTTLKRFLLLSLPFALFTAAYAIWPRQELVTAYTIFLWCYAWTVVGIGYVKMKRHIKYVHQEFSNIDRIDVSWLLSVFIFVIAGQLAWLFISLYAVVLADIVYYLSIIPLWLMVLHYSWNFRPIAVEKEAEAHSKPTPQEKENTTATPPIAEGALERWVEQGQMYLRPDLTLQEIAQALATNRTYVSNYISQVIGMSFYDYINRLRIERSAIPLINEHPEYTFEYIARQSGFASMATFRRAFMKITGQTPSQYAATRDKIKSEGL